MPTISKFEEFKKLWEGGLRDTKALAQLLARSERSVFGYMEKLRKNNLEIITGKPQGDIEVDDEFNGRLEQLLTLKHDGIGLEISDNPTKTAKVVRLHYTADPSKRTEEWLNTPMIRALRANPRKWRREYEIDYSIASGEPVYPVFDEKKHILPFDFMPGTKVIRGWDFGLRNPAVVWCQQYQGHLVALGVKRGHNISLKKFAASVIEETQLNFPGGVLDCCDPRGEQQKDTGEASIELLSSFGIYPKSRYTLIDEGLEILTQKLIHICEDGLPAFYIAEQALTMGGREMLDAFNGGYHFKEERSGATPHAKPHKDGYYEHMMDALRYIVVWLYRVRAYDAIKAEPSEREKLAEKEIRDRKWRKGFLANKEKRHNFKIGQVNPVW